MFKITFKHRGDFNSTEKFLKNSKELKFTKLLEKYAKEGVTRLAEATPKDTGLTASMWEYEISKTSSGYEISWTNSNINDGVPIAIILQYGHGTGTGGYVPGRNYINPAINPIIDKLVANLWEEVDRL